MSKKISSVYVTLAELRFVEQPTGPTQPSLPIYLLVTVSAVLPCLGPCVCRQPHLSRTKPGTWSYRHEDCSSAAEGRCVGECQAEHLTHASPTKPINSSSWSVIQPETAVISAFAHLGGLYSLFELLVTPLPLVCPPVAVHGVHSPLQEHEGRRFQSQDGVSQPAPLPPV